MLWPAPISLSAANLNSSLNRTRVVFSATPPKNKDTNLIVGAALRGPAKVGQAKSSAISGNRTNFFIFSYY
jgi:hypothetical protein